MGVINVTPDSFSDGGLYLNPDKALSRATELLNEEADVLDIGSQSTRPGADQIGPLEELKRLIPALLSIRENHKRALISVDTFLPEVAFKSLELGADWINDITGGRRNPEMFRVIADAKCPFVLMHSRGDSKSMDKYTSYLDVAREVREGLLRRTELALASGILPQNLIWDPGIGFAKTTEQNVILLRDLSNLRNEGFPLLVGPSRKRFIGSVINEPSPQQRIWGTIAVVCKCLEAKVDMVRVHDVGPTVKALRMADQLWI